MNIQAVDSRLLTLILLPVLLLVLVIALNVGVVEISFISAIGDAWGQRITIESLILVAEP